MAKDVITRFKLENNGFNSKIKEAAKTLSDLGKSATAAGKDFQEVTKGSVEAARAFGSIQTSSNNTKDKLKELTGAFNEVAKAYNSLTKEQQKSDWAKAMADSLTQLQQRIKDTKTELQGLGNEDGIFSKMGDKLGGAMSVFAGNLMTKATMEVANLGSEMAEMVKQGVEMAKAGEGIRIAFERLGNGQILDGLREATHGTVTDIELMKAAVKFNDFKLPIEELGTMLAFAQQKAKDTGQSVDYMVDSIVTGLGRKSLMILDNLGLSATEIKDKMAETGDMTKAVGEIIREQMSKAGDYVETAADRAAQANVDLQNKLEELGRKFLPVQEASNQLWTSMKIGILDIVGGPLARLLNDLTEAGRLRNALDKANGGQNGERTKVNTQLDTLRNSQKSGSDFMTRRIYSGTVEGYNRDIIAIDTMLKESKGHDANSTLKAAGQKFGTEFGSLHELRRYQEALKTMRNDYVRGAKDIMTPVKVDIKTDNAERNVDSLRGKLAELEAQRKKAIKAGDQDLAKNLTKQITQTKSDIKALDPNALKTTSSHTLTKPEQADAKYVQAQKDYEQSLQQAALEVKAGTINSAEAKKKELQAAETLWKSIGDAREVYDSPKLKEAQAKVEERIVALGPEVEKAVEAQKDSEKAARELANAQKKLADAQNELADAQASGDLKKIYAAEKKVETAQVQVDARTSATTGEQKAVDVPITISNLDAIKQKMTEEIATTPVGDSLLQNMQEAFSDASAIGAIFSTAVKNGIDTANFDTSGIMQKLLNGEDISDETIQGYVDQLNALLKEKFGETEWPKVAIAFDVKTKEITTVAHQQQQEAQKMAKDWQAAGSAIQQVGAAMNAIQDPAAKVMGTIAQAIGSVALGAGQAIQNASSMGPWAWIAFAAAATATMITTINSIHSATGYAEGGIIDGSKGGFVQGNTYSGDQVGNVRLNAGELVLNRAQQGVLADALDNEGGGAISSTPYVTGEQIYLGLNNYLKGAGYGQLVTSNG